MYIIISIFLILTKLDKMKLNDTIHATPSFYFLITLNIKPFAAIGVNVENMEYKNIKFQAWDVGGQVGIRFLLPVFDQLISFKTILENLL